MLALVMVSCQKEETETNPFIEKAQEEEGFKSQTGNSDSEIESSPEVIKPLLHMQYDGSMSREEAQASFDVEVAKFMKEGGRTNRSESHIYFQIHTYTGTGIHNESDARVNAEVNFLTDKGPKKFRAELNDPILNDRERGTWDAYYYVMYVSQISWIQAKNVTLALQGTDGWFVKYFWLYMPNNHSSYSSASGGIWAPTSPNQWLDNATENYWDYFRKDNLNTGRLTFN